MKKIKGALRIYSNQDVPRMIIIFSIILGTMIYNFTKGNSNPAFQSNISEYLNFFVYIIVVECIVTFSSRYIMYSNFDNSRKNFYKVQLIIIFIKSLASAAVMNLVVMSELVFCRFNSYDYSMEVLGRSMVNIHGLELIKLFVLILIAMIFFWSISFIFSSIERLGPLIMIIMLIYIYVLKDMFFGGLKVLQLYNYGQIIAMCTVLILINFIGAWLIIKNKSHIGDSWFDKLSKSIYSNS